MAKAAHKMRKLRQLARPQDNLGAREALLLILAVAWLCGLAAYTGIALRNGRNGLKSGAPEVSTGIWWLDLILTAVGVGFVVVPVAAVIICILRISYRMNHGDK